MANRYSLWAKPFQTEHIDAKAVWSNSLAMKGINAANLAKKVPCSLGMELVLCEQFLASKQGEFALMDFDHQRIFLFADGAVTHGEFREIGFNLEAHTAAVAHALVGFDGTNVHLVNASWKHRLCRSLNSRMAAHITEGWYWETDCAALKRVTLDRVAVLFVAKNIPYIPPGRSSSHSECIRREDPLHSLQRTTVVPKLENEMTASHTARFAAITAALAMTAIVHGTMLTGFDNVAQQAVAKQIASANAVALQKVTVTAQKS